MKLGRSEQATEALWLAAERLVRWADMTASWDPSRDWVVHRTMHERAQLTVVFDTTPPATSTMRALRILRPGLGQMQPARLKALLGSESRFDLGVFSTGEARSIAERAAQLGLGVELIDRSWFSSLPIDRSTNQALLIEDDAELERVVSEMIAAGVPVLEAYAG